MLLLTRTKTIRKTNKIHKVNKYKTRRMCESIQSYLLSHWNENHNDVDDVVLVSAVIYFQNTLHIVAIT